MHPLFGTNNMQSTNASDSAGDLARVAPVKRAERSIEPLDLLMLVMTVAVGMWLIDPIYDINDVFWHILLGDQLRAGTPFAELGSAFSFSVENPDWRTGAWGSEFLMSWLYDVGGWTLLVNTLRVGSLAGVAFVFWRHVIRKSPSRAALIPYALAMITLALTIQERPQSVSFVFIALAGVWWYRSVIDDQPPRWILVGVTAALWANLHGLWVILPGVMALAFMGRLLNRGMSDPRRMPMAAALLASLVGGCLTPLGPSGLLLAAKVQDSATNLINEWAPTTLFGWPGYVLLVAGSLTLYLLGRSAETTRAELLYALAIGAFGLMAERNVTPAVLLLTPLLTLLISRTLGPRATVSVSSRERTKLAVAAVSLAAIGVVSVVVTMTLREQGPPPSLPVELASRLADETERVRLLNDYNLSGVALFYGGDNVQVGADGRADYYGSDFLTRYHDAVSKGQDIRPLVDDLEPTHALVASDSPTATILQNDGWTVIDSDDDHTLLLAP